MSTSRRPARRGEGEKSLSSLAGRKKPTSAPGKAQEPAEQEHERATSDDPEPDGRAAVIQGSVKIRVSAHSNPSSIWAILTPTRSKP
jgi:hypothetical protein